MNFIKLLSNTIRLALKFLFMYGSDTVRDMKNTYWLHGTSLKVVLEIDIPIKAATCQCEQETTSQPCFITTSATSEFVVDLVFINLR